MSQLEYPLPPNRDKTDLIQWQRVMNKLVTQLDNLQVFANNAAAIAGGLQVGDFYRTGADPDVVCVVH